MERLWAPWRKAYIQDESKSGKGCLFCRLVKEKRDARNYIIKRTSHSFSVLNRYPYNNGHTLILPKRHVSDISRLRDDERLDWLSHLELLQEAIGKRLKPDGFNVGMNLGRVAGAGMPDHLHLHIVPRWNGDTNFMPVTGGVKVISQSLQSAHKELTEELRKRSTGKKRMSRKS